MTKELSIVLVGLFALATLAFTAYMPLAEAGLLNDPQKISDAVKTWATVLHMPTDVSALQAPVASFIAGVQKDPNCQYYVYALFLGLAMVCASIAINVVGREDAEEKTILPVKK